MVDSQVLDQVDEDSQVAPDDEPQDMSAEAMAERAMDAKRRAAEKKEADQAAVAAARAEAKLAKEKEKEEKAAAKEKERAEKQAAKEQAEREAAEAKAAQEAAEAARAAEVEAAYKGTMARVLAKGSAETMMVADITADHRSQPRFMLDQGLIDEYAEAMQSGSKFPPVTVYHDGETYWLADGFHRLAAARTAGKEQIRAEVRLGGLDEAVLYSVQANSEHGLRRSNQDKNRAVETMLTNDDWAAWSNIQIANTARVSDVFVGKVRKRLEAAQKITPQDERTTASGAKMKTGKIGAQATAIAESEPRTAVQSPELTAFDTMIAATAVISFAPEDVAQAAINGRFDVCQTLVARSEEIGAWLTRFIGALNDLAND